MKLLFLDIDGVLNSMGHAIGYNQPFLNADYLQSTGANLDPVCVAVLEKLVTENDFQIVLSSTWRTHGLDDASWIEAFNYHFDWNDFPLIGQTPSLQGMRYQEIEAFLKSFPEKVEDFIILDDDSDAWEEKPSKHFYQTDMNSGLTKAVFFWWEIRNSPNMLKVHFP